MSAIRLPLGTLLALLAILLPACGGSRSVTEAERPAAATETQAQDQADEDEASGQQKLEPDAAVAAALAGEHVLQAMTVLVVPGLGYRVEGHELDLDQVETLVAAMGKASRYRPIRIRVPPTGTVTLIQPILDVCQAHDMRNVTLWDGTTVGADDTGETDEAASSHRRPPATDVGTTSHAK